MRISPWLKGFLGLAIWACSAASVRDRPPKVQREFQGEMPQRMAPTSQPSRAGDGTLNAASRPAQAKADLQRRRFDPDPSLGDFLPRSTPEAAGLRPSALDAIIAGAEASRSEALIIISQGKVVAERYSAPTGLEELIPIHSLTKSVLSMAVGILLSEKQLPSLETPIGHWYPEWRRGPRSGIRLRHLLNHTSGLQSEIADLEVYRRRDTVAYARTLIPVDPPGKRYVYDNASTQLLAGILEMAARMPVDQFIQERLLSPIGISQVTWDKDSANHCLVYAGLSLRPRDLARIGLLMAQKGNWHGRSVVPAAWFGEATQPGPVTPGYGLLMELYSEEYTHVSNMELLGQLERAGIGFSSRLTPLLNRPFHFREEYWMEAGALLSLEERAQLVEAIEEGRSPLPYQSVPGRQTGYGHSGTFGQYLMVFPERGLVFVRLVKRFDASRPRVDFEESVMTLLRRSKVPAGVTGTPGARQAATGGSTTLRPEPW